MKKIYLIALAALFIAGCSQNKSNSNTKVDSSIACITDTLWEAEDLFGEIVNKRAKEKAK